MDRVADLRATYDRLRTLLAVEDDGTKAAAMSRELRLLGELLESIEAPAEVTVVDQLESRRRTGTGAAGVASRRRKSG